MFRRPVMLLFVLLALLALAGLLALGAFPPEVRPVPVERSLPNDRFQPR
jgi:hypothetical protein